MAICETLDDRYLVLNDEVVSHRFRVDERAKKVRLVIRRPNCDECPKYVTPSSFAGGVATFEFDTKIRNLPEGWYEIGVEVNGCVKCWWPLSIDCPCPVDYDGVDVAPVDADCGDDCGATEAPGGTPRPRRDIGCCDPTPPPETVCPVAPVCPDKIDAEVKMYTPDYEVT